MSALTFKCKAKDKQRLDMSWLSKIDTDNLSAIKKIEVCYGSNIYKLSSLFTISGNDFNDIKIINSNSRMDNIGSNLANKRLTIQGDVGYGLAKNMRSGQIYLHGNAGDNACSGMSGGSVYIYGNTGDGLCSLPTGLNQGLVDGFIYIKKNAGSNSIIRMRRGNVVIGGNIGSDSCLELISGSVTILGKIGKNFCHNARRGTIFTKDKSIARKYIRANHTDLTFYNFYKIKINQMLDKSIINCSEPLRYFGTKSGQKLIELFII